MPILVVVWLHYLCFIVTLDKSPSFSTYQFIRDSNSTWPHKAILSIKDLNFENVQHVHKGLIVAS